MAAAARDPVGFLEAHDGPVVLDEIQRVPDVLPAIKTLVDRERTPGQFLLTGSANILLLPRISESLAGRMEVLTLWPFSQGEIESCREAFIDTVFSAGIPETRPDMELTRQELVRRDLQGGIQRSFSVRRDRVGRLGSKHT